MALAVATLPAFIRQACQGVTRSLFNHGQKVHNACAVICSSAAGHKAEIAPSQPFSEGILP